MCKREEPKKEFIIYWADGNEEVVSEEFLEEVLTNPDADEIDWFEEFE